MAKKLSRTKVNEIIGNMAHAEAECTADGMDFTDDVAFELAEGLIYEYSGLKEYIIEDIGATDYVGWLANQF